MAASERPAITAGPTTEHSATKTSQSNTPNPNPAEPGSKLSTNGAVNLSRPNPTQDDAVATENTEKLSNAELKKRAKALKAAKRAKEKQERFDGPSVQREQQSQPTVPKKGFSGNKDTAPTRAQKNSEVGPSSKGQKQKGLTKQLPSRRGSVHAPADQKKKVDNKTVAVFGHLSWQARRHTIAGVGREVHPAILALGLQMRDYVICGSSARCVATLLGFKRVIESYTTPVGTSLPRHLTGHLSHQITYLAACRPLSISQGNAIRATKVAISSIDPSCPEGEAKTTLCDFIDSFIREKITVADRVIANSAAQKVQDGDVILCYAGSNIVQKTLLAAHHQGKKFRVSIIDSRPLFEGRHLARTLANAGIQVQYSLIHGISHALEDATKVFLGAHGMTSNGRLFSRVGTALIAMSAKQCAGGVNIPVIVCCETVKFTDRVALDSIVVNEIADPDELVAVKPSTQITDLPLAPAKSGAANVSDSSSKSNTATLESEKSVIKAAQTTPLENWRDTPNLQLLNIMYDVTPAEYIDMVITEMGSLPPSAVSIVHRMSTNS